MNEFMENRAMQPQEADPEQMQQLNDILEGAIRNNDAEVVTDIVKQLEEAGAEVPEAAREMMAEQQEEQTREMSAKERAQYDALMNAFEDAKTKDSARAEMLRQKLESMYYEGESPVTDRTQEAEEQKIRKAA